MPRSMGHGSRHGSRTCFRLLGSIAADEFMHGHKVTKSILVDFSNHLSKINPKPVIGTGKTADPD
jgi:hypothetical protein